MKEDKKGGSENYIYLFRHGKTDFNTKKIFTGWMDSKLTKEGIKNAKEISKKLKNKKIDVAIYSHLSRSKDTLKYVLNFHPECKTLICDDRIIERSYGELEGMNHKKFIKTSGKILFKLGEYNFNGMNKKEYENFLGEKEYEAIHRGWEISAKDGESFLDVEKRVGEFICWIKEYIKKNNVNIVISAHGNSIRVFRKIWESKKIEEATKWFIPYDKVYTYLVN